jgi:DNA modification methylase
VSPNTHARLSQDVQNQVGSARANGGAKTNGNMKAVGRKLYSGTGVGFGRGYDKVAKPRAKNNASFDEAMAIMPDTRNKRSVWSMVTQSFKDAHFATFPTELPETCIKAGCPPGGTVLDPFFGAGTTGLVADRLQRDCIGIELNPAYAEIARKRIQAESPLLANIQVAA